jgi:hypothetical protein
VPGLGGGVRKPSNWEVNIVIWVLFVIDDGPPGSSQTGLWLFFTKIAMFPGRPVTAAALSYRLGAGAPACGTFSTRIMAT